MNLNDNRMKARTAWTGYGDIVNMRDENML